MKKKKKRILQKFPLGSSNPYHKTNQNGLRIVKSSKGYNIKIIWIGFGCQCPIQPPQFASLLASNALDLNNQGPTEAHLPMGADVSFNMLEVHHYLGKCGMFSPNGLDLGQTLW